MKVAYLDGIIQTLDRMGEAGMKTWLIAPAQHILGLDWVAPYLAGGFRDARANRVFVDGKVRHLRPYDWWVDPSVIQRRIALFREMVAAWYGHPALKGWLIMDRALEWPCPEKGEVEIVLQSFLAEIRERDEFIDVFMGIGWSELLDPKLVLPLVGQVSGLRLSGFDGWPSGIEGKQNPVNELFMAAYMGTLARWVFDYPVEVEIGWSGFDKTSDLNEVIQAGECLAGQGLNGVSWATLVDPEPWLYDAPPWNLKSGLNNIGILDPGLEPKALIETVLESIRSDRQENPIKDFIDLDKDDYLEDPHFHLKRLWHHFLEAVR